MSKKKIKITTYENGKKVEDSVSPIKKKRIADPKYVMQAEEIMAAHIRKRLKDAKN